MCADALLMEIEFQLIKLWQFEDYVKTVRSKQTETQNLIFKSKL